MQAAECLVVLNQFNYECCLVDLNQVNYSNAMDHYEWYSKDLTKLAVAPRDELMNHSYYIKHLLLSSAGLSHFFKALVSYREKCTSPMSSP